MEPLAIKDILEIKNLGLQPPEMMLPASGEETELSVALLSPAIRNSSMEELKQVLRLVMIKVGLRGQNWPQDEEKMVLIQHVISNFGGNRIDEIKLAFEMAIAGKLDLKHDETKCFENFSCAYFSTIMTAYRYWATQAAKSILKEDPPPAKIYTDSQLDDLHRGDIEAFYQRIRLGRVPYALPEYFKDILVKDGLMKEGDTLAEFFMNRLGKGIENVYVKSEQ